MEKHMKLSDDEFEKQFFEGTFHATQFTHEAHLRLAWIHVTRYGLKSAMQNVQRQLKLFVSTIGAFDKFHTTVTIAAIKAVHHFVSKSKSTNFRDFIQECPRLKTDFKSLISQHYGFDIYHSQAARESFIEPDLLPFD